MSAQAFGWVLDSSASKGTSRLVLLSIANHVDPSGEGWAYVSTILREANVHLASYHRAIPALTALGELQRLTNEGGSARTRPDARPNHFRLTKFALARGRQLADPVGKRPPQGAQEGPPQDDYPATSAGCSPIALPDIAIQEPLKSTRGMFDLFWDRYPRKVGKPQATKAFERATKRATPQTILVALEAQRLVWQHSEKRFIPHPTTWLQRDGWADEVAGDPPGSRGSQRGSAPRRPDVKTREEWEQLGELEW